MSLLTNPVLVSVVVLCVLCLLKLNVLMSLIIAAMTGAVLGGISIPDAMGILCDGFSGNANTALAYVLLGTFATAIASTGLADMASKKLSQIMGGKSASVLLLILAAVACLSQNLIPVHIAFIPILIPPMLAMFNEMKVDRRGVACALSFGLKAPYISIPFGFGAIFMGIIADNMTANGMETSVSEVSHYNWMLGCCMLVGLLIAVFVTYRKPREYKDIAIDGHEITADDLKLTKDHIVGLVSIVAVLVVQLTMDSMPLGAMAGLAILFLGGAVKIRNSDGTVAEGIRLMGMISFVMLIAGGYANVVRNTGAVDTLIDATLGVLGDSRSVAIMVLILIGLLITMGIGTSFGTIPVIALLYVPMCQRLGISLGATTCLIACAAVLGDAGSPASDSTLGPTAGLNADGQHDHIWDTCVPTFLFYNIPLVVAGFVGCMIL